MELAVFWLHLLPGHLPDHPRTAAPDQKRTAGSCKDKVQIVLVSVDPNRDTPKQLKQYLGYFDPQFVGLTPRSIDDLQTVANALSIPFIPADTSKPGYTVDHSGNLALIGPDGTQRGFIRAPLNTQKMVAQLPSWCRENKGESCSRCRRLRQRLQSYA